MRAACLAFLLVAACASGSGTSSPPAGMTVAEIMVGDTDLTVWVADTPEERSQGLRRVAALPEGIDGMLFTWEAPTNPTFGMRDTLFPLDLWWFGPEGALLGVTTMTPCSGDDCIGYPAPGPVSSALETPAGAHRFEPGVLLTTS